MKRLDLGMIGVALTTLAIAFMFSACDNDTVQDEVNVEDPVEEIVFTYAAVQYKNNEFMGTTRAEPAVDGNFQIYDLGTGVLVGMMQVDTSVSSINGRELGLCAGAVASDTGVDGDCTLPSYKVEHCPDTRNGDFNPAYSPAVCNANGYFFCSLAMQCLNKPVNVPTCGEIGNR